jgi:hypothetical protein
LSNIDASAALALDDAVVVASLVELVDEASVEEEPDESVD